MLSGQKILVTGVTGKAVIPIARFLAKNNEVWGLARFARAGEREKIAALGIVPLAAELGSGDFSDIPTDFTYVLHFAWMRADLPRLEEAIRVNVEGPGLLLQHCSKAKAALVVSSMGVYSTNPQWDHAYTESDPIGRGATSYAATSPPTKLGLEAVARFCARAFNLPVTIARLNTVLGPMTAYHGNHISAILDGRPIIVPGDPNPHTPIHSEDMQRQIEPFLDAASTTALITNWCGDETVTSQQSAAMASEWSGKPAQLVIQKVDGGPQGNRSNNTRRLSITGPCQVSFKDGFRRLYDEIVASKATPSAR